MEHFILNNSWFFFRYIFRIFGFYAFNRDEENNKIIPRSAVKIWIHFLSITGTICLVCIGIPFIYLMYSESITIEKFQNVVFEMFFSGGTSSFVMMIHPMIINSIGLIMVFKLRDLAVGLSEFQDYYTINNKDGFINLRNVTKKFMKVRFCSLLNLLVIILGITFFAICYGPEMRVRLNVSPGWNLMLPLIIGNPINAILMWSPIAYFFFIYGEIILLMLEWCTSIMSIENGILMIEKTKVFMNGLNFIKDRFSYFIFWLTLAFLISIIGEAYYMFVPFMDQESFSGAWQFGTLSMLAFFFCAMFLLYNLCSYSEFMANKVQELKRKILDIQFQNGEADAILILLDEFKGFNGDGYFTLNKALLTSMTSNFICFFVILIQFKQSESNNNDNKKYDLEFCHKIMNKSLHL